MMKRIINYKCSHPRTYFKDDTHKQGFRYNLQFFAKEGLGGEKTEEASPKKISDARKEGQVAKSMELILGTTLLAFFLLLKIFISYMAQGLKDSFLLYYKNIAKFHREDFTVPLVQGIFQEFFFISIKVTFPIIGITLLTIILSNVAQVKWQITTKPLKPKLSNFNPIKGFKKIFSKDKLVVLVKDVLKISLILYIAYSTIIGELTNLIRLYDMSFTNGIKHIGELAINLGIRIGIVYVIVGILDLFYQKFKFKKDLKMTKQEVKEELKQTEGNPQTKSRIRGKMRETSRMRMMESVPEADVIITNPTHLAVAIKYDTESSDAPILLAKGADNLAAKIKEIAKANKIPVMENKPLARMLYFNVEIGEEIPPELYQMTAQVLAYVYSLNGKGDKQS